MCGTLILKSYEKFMMLVSHSFVLGTKGVTGRGRTVTMVDVEPNDRGLRVMTAMRSTTQVLTS